MSQLQRRQPGTCIDAPAGPDAESICAGFGVCDGIGHCAEGEYVLGRQFGGPNQQVAYGVAAAGEGAFLIGGATDTIDTSWSVDGITVGTTNQANNGWFYASFNGNGQALFGESFGSLLAGGGVGALDEISAVAIAGDGSLYLAGWINSVL